MTKKPEKNLGICAIDTKRQKLFVRRKSIFSWLCIFLVERWKDELSSHYSSRNCSKNCWQGNQQENILMLVINNIFYTGYIYVSYINFSDTCWGEILCLHCNTNVPRRRPNKCSNARNIVLAIKHNGGIMFKINCQDTKRISNVK